MKIAKEYRKVAFIGAGACVVALVLSVLGADASLSASSSAKDIELQKEKIDNFLEQKPCPVKENLDLILKDNEILETEIARARYSYGHPEQAALEIFCREMGGIESLKFQKAWTDANKKMGVAPAFDSFLNDYLKATDQTDKMNLRDGAKRKVAKMFEKLSFRKIDDVDLFVTRILSSALGEIQNIEPSRCQLEIHNADKFIREVMSENVAQPIKFLEGKTFYYTFDDYKDKSPSRDDVLSIFRQANAIEYILRLVKNSQLAEVVGIQRKSVVNPESDVNGAKYIDPATRTLAYTFEFKLKGTQKALRDFTNSLYKASLDNYFFEISKLSIVKSNLVDEELALINPKVEEKRTSSYMNNTETKKELPMEQNSVPLIGIDNLLDATFVINSYYYVPPVKKTSKEGK